MFILPEVKELEYLPCKVVDVLSKDKDEMTLIYAFMVNGKIQYFYTSGNKLVAEVSVEKHLSPKQEMQGSIP